MRQGGILEADVVTAKGPPVVHVTMDRGERQGDDAPYQRVVHDRDVVGNGQQTFAARLVVRARLEEVEEPREAVDFGLVQAVEEGARQGRDGEEGLVSRRTPKQAGLLCIGVVEVVIVVAGDH